MSSEIPVKNSADICNAADTKEKKMLIVRGSSVPVAFCRVSGSAKTAFGLKQVIHAGFRKIEPKPSMASKEENCENKNGSDNRKNSRLMESKSTRRGVRICPNCHGRVGYRSKVCKHCLETAGLERVRSSSTVKKRRPKKNKGKTEKKTEVVSEHAEQNLKNTKECHTVASMDNLDLEIRISSPLETISEQGNQFCGTSDLPCVVENQCSLVSRNNDENVFEDKTEQLHPDNEANTSLDKGHSDMAVLQGVACLEGLDNSFKLPQKLDTKETCQKSDLISSSPGMAVMKHDYEELYESANIEQGKSMDKVVDAFSNGVTYKVIDIKNLQTMDSVVGDTAKNILPLTSVEKITIENLKTDSGQCFDGSRYDKEVPVEEDRSVAKMSEDVNTEEINSKVLPFKESNSPPVILMDVNSVSSISVNTTEDNSCVDIVAEIKLRREQRGNAKRKKKPQVWQDLKKKKKTTSGFTGVSAVQFVRIQPKPSVEIREAPKKMKLESAKQNRLLSSNPTRRGIMLCPLCQKDVGCRSKICKFCKVTIHACTGKSPFDQKNLLAVKLSQQTCPEYTIFSVKKTLDVSEDRCFVNKIKSSDERFFTNAWKSEVFHCDCAASNLSEKPSCEHTVCLYKRPEIALARNITLKRSKIGMLPIDIIFKHKLVDLWEIIKDEEFPLVQQVCLNTLVVLDVHSNVERTPSSCVHVRFEKIRRRSVTELHIFCSGLTCSAWNKLDNSDRLVTCIHYCISLWAIASDNDLLKCLKVFLDASQVYLHSEVLYSVLEE